MIITSRSVQHFNIVFAFDEKKFVVPENSEITGFFQASDLIGANFADDSVLRVKILNLPRIKMQVVFESNRIIFESSATEEISEENLIKIATDIHRNFFANFPLTGFGFNFDVFYRFNEAIQLKSFFEKFGGKKILEGSDLRDAGIQFTLDKKGGEKIEQHFVKIISPLEIAIHSNHHFPMSALQKNFGFMEVLQKCYDATDLVAENLEF